MMNCIILWAENEYQNNKPTKIVLAKTREYLENALLFQSNNTLWKSYNDLGCILMKINGFQNKEKSLECFDKAINGSNKLISFIATYNKAILLYQQFNQKS